MLGRLREQTQLVARTNRSTGIVDQSGIVLESNRTDSEQHRTVGATFADLENQFEQFKSSLRRDRTMSRTYRIDSDRERLDTVTHIDWQPHETNQSQRGSKSIDFPAD